MIGKTISHYKIVEKLGEGGMGVVYRAEDSRLKRTIALKFLSAHAVGTEEEKARFVHEAQAAAALNHPNICTIYEIDEWEGQSFIAMECIEGESLKARVEQGPLKLDDVVAVVKQVAEGLQKAHEKSIIHRDIKTANIMVTTEGQAKIMDFGLAKSPGRTKLTRTSTTVGTVAYMSPEQSRGEEVDHRTDIWSLGVVLYEMVTGRLPFRGDYEQAVVYSILNEAPEPLTALRTGVPAELERIANKCLAKDPEERYQTALDLAADCRHLARELAARRPLFRPEAQPGARRRPGAWRIAAVSLAVLTTLAILLVGLNVGNWRDRLFAPGGQGGVGRIESLAILPFVDAGSDPDTEYLSEEIPASISIILSRLSSLRVVPRSTAFRFRGRGSDLRAVGQELNVRAILTGQISVRGDKLSIRAELVDVVNDRQLWGDRFIRRFADIIGLEEEIAEQISEALRLRLGVDDRIRLAKRYTDNPEAHRLYLKGRYFWNKRTEAGFRQAITFFQQAIEKDPAYALAYTGLADSYCLLADYGIVSREDVMPKAKAAALKALEIDDTLAEAHVSLAGVLDEDWQWSAAEREYKRAIELSPIYATAYHWYAWLLALTGRLEEAFTVIKRAQELDPLSLIINVSVGVLHAYARQCDLAIEEYRKVIEMDPSFAQAHAFLGQAYAQKGMYDQAIAELGQAVTLSGAAPEFVAFLGSTYALAGMSGKAREILNELSERAERVYVPPCYFAMIHASLGEKDKAFEWLEKAYNEHDANMRLLIMAPVYDPLRGDPRFENLLRRMGLAPLSFTGSCTANPPVGKIMLAVLPFDNLSADPDEEYFSDGMTEEIIAQIGRLQPNRLGVIARTTAMKYKNSDRGINQISSELGVHYVLEGSVRRASGRVRITTRLIQASDQTQIWTDIIERELTDILKLQSSVADGIAQALALELLPSEKARLAEARPVNPEAFDAYIKGRYHWNRRTDQDMRKSLAYFQEAVDSDPSYALAYVGVADVCALLGINGHVAPREIIPRARAAALKALEIDSTLAEAHASLGFILAAYDRDWTGGWKELERAVELNPGYATTRLWRAVWLACKGRFNQAVGEIKLAQQLDPLALMLSVNKARFLCWAGRYEEALEEARKALELDPDFPFAHWALALVHRHKGMYDEAVAEFKQAVTLAGGHPGEHQADLGYAYALAGRDDEARKLLDELKDYSQQGYIAPTIIARVYIGLDEKDRAFEWLDKAYEEHDAFLLSMKADPVYDNIRSDPRFTELLKKIGLAQ